MVARAEAKYIRIAPSKLRLVVELIKNLKVTRATAVLKTTNKKGAFYLEKVLHSAISNAKQKGFKEDNLFISRAIANPGPSLKRYRAASFGRASIIRKRLSHIILELDAPKDVKVAPVPKKKPVKKPKVKKNRGR